MIPKRISRYQRSGHCESGAQGGHERCKYYFSRPGRVCACKCHEPPKDKP